ncbi:MAG: ABC transporter permease [Cellvibrionaceae bacterium]
MKKIITVLRKELLDALRDKRALSTIFIVPIINLVVIAAMVQFMVFMQKSGEGFSLPIYGAENAIPIVDWLEERGINTRTASEDAIERVKNGTLDFVLVVPDDFSEKFDALKPATLELIYDRSRKDVMSKVMNIKYAVQQWSSQIGALRLLTRGVSPNIMTPVVVEDSDVAKEKTGSGMIFSVVALILTFTIFTSSTGVSIDMMAGEREKKSLEPLLLSPVSRWSILIGKWGTAMAVTTVVILFVSFSMYFLLPVLPLEKLGIRSELSFFNICAILAVSIPLVMISTIFQLFVSIFSKSFKEAQSYIGLLMVLPIMVGYYVIWSDVANDWQYWVPVMSTQMLMEDILSVGYSDFKNYFGSFFVSIGLSLLLAIVTVRQLKREKIIYG